MDLTSHVIECINLAEQKQSKLTDEIALWHNHDPHEGMSTPRIRHLFNNLLDKNIANKHGITETNYLEIGTWKGSTAVPALYKNKFQSFLVLISNTLIPETGLELKYKYNYGFEENFDLDTTFLVKIKDGKYIVRAKSGGNEKFGYLTF